MRFSKNQKTARFGWSLHIKRQVDEKFERVGDFRTRHDADVYRQKYFSNATAARVQGIRANVQPLRGREGADEK